MCRNRIVVIQRNLRKVLFHRRETLPDVHAIMPGVEVVTWNTAKHTIAAKLTMPLPILVMPDVWSQLARRDIPVDDWLVDEREQTEEVDAWVR